MTIKVSCGLQKYADEGVSKVDTHLVARTLGVLILEREAEL